MKYRIIINKVEEEKGTEEKWVKLLDSDAPEMKAIPYPDQYGYKKFPYTKEVQTTVLEQTTDDIKITEVIKAINGL